MAGTRFKLFPQPPLLDEFAEPETVEIDLPAGTVGPGPADHRMYAVFPFDKPSSYAIAARPGLDGHELSPPWMGDIFPPAEPDEHGHFDHLEPGTPQFEAAHLFGTVRFVLDVWERYMEREVRFHFADRYDRLELSILPSLDNAFAGYGFIEVGADTTNGRYVPYSLNFDVIAHEVAHIIIYGEVGDPDIDLVEGEYWGFQESSADLVALISSLHFDSVVNRLLDDTSGNLYTLNIMNRMGELSASEQIRSAANDVHLSQFADGWIKPHALSQPLTGAIFDIFVDIFHENLVENGLISPEVEDLSDELLATPDYLPVMQGLFDEAYAADPYGFKDALIHTRDIVGTYLAETWGRLEPEGLTFARVADVFAQVDIDILDGRYQRIIRGNFDMRGIGFVEVGPHVAPVSEKSHVHPG